MRHAPILLALVLLPLHAPSAAASPYEEAQAIVSDPKELAARYDEAVRKFREAAETNPDRAHRAWYNLGLLHHMRDRSREAAEAWRKALESQPGYPPARARLAQLELRGGDREAALRTLEEIVADNRYQAEARNVLAQVAIEEEDWETAIKHARNVLLGDPENINAYLNLAVAYFRQGHVDQAWLITSNALDRRPDAAALHNMMGLIYLEKDDSRHATESFLRAVKEDPRHVDAKLNLAAMELSYGDFESAVKRFDDVLTVRPDDPMVLISRAVALRGLGRFEEAEQGYEAALAVRPGMPEALYNLCVLHHQYTTKDGIPGWEEAEVACERYAAEIDEGHPKHREIAKRLESVGATLEALREAEAERRRQERLERERREAGEAEGADPPDEEPAPEGAEEPAPDDDGGDAGGSSDDGGSANAR